MNVTLRQLRAFLAVTDLASFTRAAERLHISQSAISLLIGDLEGDLRVKLLNRTTRRVEPTEAGRQFAVQAAKILLDLDHAVRHAHGLSQRLHGRLSVFAPPLLAITLLPDVIAAYCAAYPGIEVTLVDGGTDGLVAQVRSGEVDFAVGTVPTGLEDLTLLPLAADQLIAFCRSGSDLTRRRAVAWQELRSHAVIALTRQSGLRQLIDTTTEAAGFLLEPAFEVAHITTALALVEAGLGVAILPSIARSLVGRRSLSTHLITEPTVGRAIHLVHRVGHVLSPAGSAFVAVLRQELRKAATQQRLSVRIKA